MPIWVESAQGKYPFYAGHGILTNPSLLKDFLFQKSLLILSHPEIAQHYLSSLCDICWQADAYQVEHLLIPSGEQHKTLKTAEKIWSFLLAHHYHRDTVVIALGGGMIGDMAGFCAACYMRGVPVIQVPTTLLAQIDASIGGKTGVNHRLGKNMIGAFHPPLAVIADVRLLETLPLREFHSGLAELIKYGMAIDEDFFSWLEYHMPDIVARKKDIVVEAIQWAARLKANIVSQDEKENNIRIVLNFGHTIAHVIENLLHYREWLHGEAVAIGMLVAADLSIQQGILAPSCLDRLVNLLTAARLPLAFPKIITVAKILTTLKQDKKNRQQKLSWVLLNAIGQTTITETVSQQQITIALKRYGAQ